MAYAVTMTGVFTLSEKTMRSSRSGQHSPERDTPVTAYDMTELNRESQMGAVGTETTDREVRRISIADFEDRFDGSPTNSGRPQPISASSRLSTTASRRILSTVCSRWRTPFHLPTEIKEQYPLQKGTNAGWEYGTQVRPSTGTADRRSPTSTPNRAWTGCGPARTNWPDSVPPSRISEAAAGRLRWIRSAASQ